MGTFEGLAFAWYLIPYVAFISRSQLLAALLPMFFSSNYSTHIKGAINTLKFDGPTRALNATLESVGAIIGALMNWIPRSR